MADADSWDSAYHLALHPVNICLVILAGETLSSSTPGHISMTVDECNRLSILWQVLTNDT